MADNILVKIKDIKGQSQQTNYADYIECMSYSHGVSIQVTGDTTNSERTSGRPNHQDFHLTKYVDQATPALNQNCSAGKNLGEVTVTVGRNDQEKFLELLVYTLKDVVISSVSVGGGGGDKPVESFSLNYSSIKWQYTKQDLAGNKKGQELGSWNVAKNAKDY